MRIAIINITGGGISGGYQVYLKNVLPRLAVHPGVEAVLCAAPQLINVPSWFPSFSKVTFIDCKPFRFMRHRPNRELEQEVQRFAPDVIFIPVERYLNFKNIPLVVMVQNMGPLAPVAGNPISERMRYVAQRLEARLAVKRATQVIAPTDFVRDFLVQRWNTPRAKVRTIHYGSIPHLDEHIVRTPAGILDAWKGQFLFTAGSIEPYRGLEDILGAMHRLKGNSELKGLVIAGEARTNMIKYRKKLERWVYHHGLRERIVWLGKLTQDQMSWCYDNCRAFVMTSRVESFGIIGLDAMAHGCVCVVADNPPLPEIFGDAAVYYPPTDGKALAESIQSILHFNTTKQTEISEQARRRATTFSWDRTTERTLAVFAEAM